MSIIHKLKGVIWLYQGNAPWHFVTIGKKDMEIIHKDVLSYGGFKSIKVNVTLGKTNWRTSIFKDKDDSYLLPIKKRVRKLENIKAGDKINFNLEVIS